MDSPSVSIPRSRGRFGMRRESFPRYAGSDRSQLSQLMYAIEQLAEEVDVLRAELRQSTQHSANQSVTSGSNASNSANTFGSYERRENSQLQHWMSRVIRFIKGQPQWGIVPSAQTYAPVQQRGPDIQHSLLKVKRRLISLDTHKKSYYDDTVLGDEVGAIVPPADWNWTPLATKINPAALPALPPVAETPYAHIFAKPEEKRNEIQELATEGDGVIYLAALLGARRGYPEGSVAELVIARGEIIRNVTLSYLGLAYGLHPSAAGLQGSSTAQKRYADMFEGYLGALHRDARQHDRTDDFYDWLGKVFSADVFPGTLGVPSPVSHTSASSPKVDAKDTDEAAVPAEYQTMISEMEEKVKSALGAQSSLAKQLNARDKKYEQLRKEFMEKEAKHRAALEKAEEIQAAFKELQDAEEKLTKSEHAKQLNEAAMKTKSAQTKLSAVRKELSESNAAKLELEKRLAQYENREKLEDKKQAALKVELNSDSAGAEKAKPEEFSNQAVAKAKEEVVKAASSGIESSTAKSTIKGKRKEKSASTAISDIDEEPKRTLHPDKQEESLESLISNDGEKSCEQMQSGATARSMTAQEGQSRSAGDIRSKQSTGSASSSKFTSREEAEKRLEEANKAGQAVLAQMTDKANARKALLEKPKAASAEMKTTADRSDGQKVQKSGPLYASRSGSTNEEIRQFEGGVSI